MTADVWDCTATTAAVKCRAITVERFSFTLILSGNATSEREKGRKKKREKAKKRKRTIYFAFKQKNKVGGYACHTRAPC